MPAGDGRKLHFNTCPECGGKVPYYGDDHLGPFERCENRHNLRAPRAFTRHELSTLTTDQYAALSPADKAIFEVAYWLAIAEPPVYLAQYVAGDYDMIDSNRRFGLGE